jgi:CHAT domain-containing protein/tetratricopeptide (TPR) repeat protein
MKRGDRLTQDARRSPLSNCRICFGGRQPANRSGWAITYALLAAGSLALSAAWLFPTAAAGAGPSAKPELTIGHEPMQQRDEMLRRAAQLRFLGQYTKAADSASQALALTRAVFGDRHEDIAAILRRLAELHAISDDLASARKEAREALEVQSKLPGAKSWQVDDARRARDRIEGLSNMNPSQRLEYLEAARLSDQALVLYIAGNFRDGIKLARKAQEISERTLGARNPDLAVALNNLAVFHLSLGEYDKADPLYRRALDIFKAVLGEEHPDYLTTFNNLAVLHGLRGDYKIALPLYRQALEMRKQTLGERHPDYVRSMNNLAWLYKAMGDYSNAEPLYLKALHLYEQGLSYGWPEGGILEIYRQTDLRRPLLGGEMQADLALIVGNLAVCYHEMGEYARAEPLYLRALEINKRIDGETSAASARNLNNLAAVYQLMGDNSRAETLFQKALALRKGLVGENHPDYATSLHNLGRFYYLVEDYDRAEPLYLQALAIRKRRLGEKHPYYAQTLDKLAMLYHAKGDYARAEPLYIQALEARRNALGEKHRYDATILTNQALLYQEMGNCDQAYAIFRKSLEWTKKRVGEQKPEYARTLHHLAMLEFARKRYAEAERLARQALEVSRNLVERCAGVQSERQQLAMMQTSRFYLDGYLTVAAEAAVSAEQVYGQVLAWKGAVLVRQRRMRLQRIHPELAAAFAKLNRASGRLAALALASPDPTRHAAFRRQIDDLTEEKERLEADLSDRCAAFRKERESERRAPSELQAALPPEAVLVDFLEYLQRRPPARGKGRWSFQRRLMAFVVRSGSLLKLDAGPAQPVADAIDHWRATYAVGKLPSDGMADPTLELRRRLWQPLEPHLKGVTLVLLSPDGPLHGLPLAALPGARPNRFLIQDYAFATIAVPQLLPELVRGTPVHPKEPPTLLLAGGINFDREDAPSGEARTGKLTPMPRFGRLAGTESEVNDLRTQFEDAFPDAPAPKLLRKDKATKAAFLAAAPGRRFVHLATHGFFAGESETPTVAVAQRTLSPSDGMGMRIEATGGNPGLLSGVVFAGANRTDQPREEAVLTALEAGELDLRGVELIVLSACETGRGRLAGGEGVLGLQRSFQLAGARSVMASLWKVPDEETHLLMREFYRRVWSDKHVSRAEALRQAQIWMLENWKPRGLDTAESKGAPPPYFWAAFVLSGDWR